METALTKVSRRYAMLAVAATMVALIAGLALTGKPPALPELRFEARGIVAAAPPDFVEAEIHFGEKDVVFRRNQSGPWTFYPPVPVDVPRELASHLDTALQFMHVSAPVRTLEPNEYHGASFNDFGLDPPAYVVSLGTADGSATIVDFGTLTPAKTSQYVRLVGQPMLYLMPRHVGGEWQLTADMARRVLPPSAAGRHETAAAGRSAGLLLPASINQVWAIEIVFEAKLHRFERDSAGNWFLHVGQHTHSGNRPAHVADPAKASIIASALTALDQSQIEAVVARHPSGTDLERYGLGRPMLIALMYARDSSSPLARLAIGNMANDGFSRYARVSDGGDVVTIAGYQATGILDLLKAVGAAS